MGARAVEIMLPCQLLKVRFCRLTPAPEPGVWEDHAPSMSSAYALECPMKLVKAQFFTVPEPPLDFIWGLVLEWRGEKKEEGGTKEKCEDMR